MAPQNVNIANAKVVKQEPLSSSDAVWTRLTKITYTDPLGKTRDWEAAERTTRPATSAADGVGVVAILKKPTGPELLLQKQFRPPANKVMIEVPAGLIDAGESPAECAVRELKEETGYIGVVEQGDQVIMFNDPGFCNTNTLMINVSVDMSLPANQNPKPELEENEFIETFSLPLATLWKDLVAMDREGYAIDARVGTLAEGFEIGRRFAAGGI